MTTINQDERIVMAQQYIKEKMIDDLFSHLATVMIYNQPADPKAFIVEELQRMKRDKSPNRKDFFDATDLTTMFQMFDITGKGYITPGQFEQALVNLGRNSVDTSHITKKGGRISLDQFIKEISPHITLNIPSK